MIKLVGLTFTSAMVLQLRRSREGGSFPLSTIRDIRECHDF